MTPFTAACKGRSEAVCSLLLDRGAHAHIPDGQVGPIPLIQAAAAGLTSVCSRLLAMGADPNKKSASGGSTALLISLERSHEATAVLLLDSGARCDVADEGGRTPLSCAVEKGLKEAERRIRERLAGEGGGGGGAGGGGGGEGGRNRGGEEEGEDEREDGK